MSTPKSYPIPCTSCPSVKPSWRSFFRSQQYHRSSTTTPVWIQVAFMWCNLNSDLVRLPPPRRVQGSLANTMKAHRVLHSLQKSSYHCTLSNISIMMVIWLKCWGFSSGMEQTIWPQIAVWLHPQMPNIVTRSHALPISVRTWEEKYWLPNWSWTRPEWARNSKN